MQEKRLRDLAPLVTGGDLTGNRFWVNRCDRQTQCQAGLLRRQS
jgi:hypothetical protein